MSTTTSSNESPRKKQSMEREEESLEPVSQSNLVMENALLNVLILKHIFGFLNNDDVKSCFNVNKFWRSEALPVLFQYYEIKFRSDWMPCWKPFILQELDSYKRQILLKYEFNFEDAIKSLEQVMPTQKIVIRLRVRSGIDIENNNVKTFLSKFGPHVKDLVFKGHEVFTMSLNVFCNFLLTSLPNLNSLNCSYLEFEQDSPQELEFNPDLPQNKLKQLKRISFMDFRHITFETYGSREFQKILRMAPNLEEIHELPIWLINEVLDKGPLLKSVSYSHHAHCDRILFGQNGLTSLLAFQKLAELQPKLTTFSLLPFTYCLGEGISLEMLKPFLFSVLQSSAESLRSFEITLTERYGFQNLPKLNGLKTLIFTHPLLDTSDFIGGRFLQPKILLPQIFPNVSGIRIKFLSTRRYLNDTWISQFLPENIISPWGSQIKRLYLPRISFPSVIPLLQRLFPEIEHLEISGFPDCIKRVLPGFAKFWPNLKSMGIEVLDGPFHGDLTSGVLDSALTGLSKEIVDQLMDQSKRENFTEDQIRAFKNRSTISKFKELQYLTLTLPNHYILKSIQGDFASISHVTDDFGFKLVPDLKVTVGIKNDLKDSTVKIKTELEPLAGSSDVKIKELYLASGLFL